MPGGIINLKERTSTSIRRGGGKKEKKGPRMRPHPPEGKRKFLLYRRGTVWTRHHGLVLGGDSYKKKKQKREVLKREMKLSEDRITNRRRKGEKEKS